MKGRGNKQHMWEPGWSEVDDEPVDKCINCGLMRRGRQLYVRGTLMKAAKTMEYYIDGKWIQEYHVEECKGKQ